MTNNVLFIYDFGDTSVGMFPQEWAIPTPFDLEDADAEERENFRQYMIAYYSEYANGRVTSYFSDERIIT